MLYFSLAFFLALAWVGRQATKLPEGRAADILAAGRPAATVVACLGDSITHGRIGSDWVTNLREKMGPEGWSFINEGINGNVVWQLRRRLEPVLACEPDAVVVLIGTNDVMGSFHEDDGRVYVNQGNLPEVPSIECYERELGYLLDSLQHIPKRGICTLPPLGEDPSSAINALVGRFNSLIETAAEDKGFTVLPLNAELIKILHERGAPPQRDYLPGSARIYPILQAILSHYLLGKSWDACAKRRDLVIFPDYIHFGERAGEIMGKLAEEFIRS